MVLAYTLAYYDVASIMAVKTFIVDASAGQELS
jgi:hypothetical protein